MDGINFGSNDFIDGAKSLIKSAMTLLNIANPRKFH